MEKRHNYVRKVAEVATTLFISNDKPNICGLILAGSADFKTELSQSDMFDPVSCSEKRHLSIHFLRMRTKHQQTVLFSFCRDYKLKLSSWLMCHMEAKTASIKQLNWQQSLCKMSNLFKRKSLSGDTLMKSAKTLEDTVSV